MLIERSVFLTDFRSIRPDYPFEQNASLKWLKKMHSKQSSSSEFCDEITNKVDKVCCKKEQISQRFISIPEELREEWDTFGGIGKRGRYYQKCAEKFFSQFYLDASTPPSDLIHVTCTGYNSPSAAQTLVASKGWEQNTMVTHAYHMGCMAALPAIRIALGYGSYRENFSHIDLVHTEFCSLHMNPHLHTYEELIAQSLFADGLIKYSLVSSSSSEKKGQLGLKIKCVHEEIIPGTEKKMQWICEDWGLKLTLSKEIPLLISRNIQSFIQRLEAKIEISLQDAFLAIHPGGPKIIDLITEQLNLSERQIASTKKIFFHYGNMSSATLPHIWEDMLKDASTPIGATIIGLAFGPGLSMCGIVLEKAVI